jgi:hypothetical protein
MSMKCEDHRRRILEASIENLSPEEQQVLEAHLAECPSCVEEQHRTLDALQRLCLASDLPVPRHFFVAEEQSRPSPWSLFRQMSLTWQVTTAFVLLVFILTAIAVFRFEVKTQANQVTLSLGKPSQLTQSTVSAPVKVEALKADILQALEEKARQERLSWMREMRKELALSNRRLTQKQQKSLEIALAEFDARANERMIARDLALQADWRQSLGELYGTIQVQRKRDLLSTKDGIDRLAAEGEARSNATEAILTTLLQVAEYKTK